MAMECKILSEVLSNIARWMNGMTETMRDIVEDMPSSPALDNAMYGIGEMKRAVGSLENSISYL